MATFNRVIGVVRRQLRFPREDKVSDGIIVEFLFDKLAYYLTALGLVNQNWHLERYQLDVQPGEQEYVITAQAWGTPILCETIDPSNPQHRMREVDFVKMQDRARYYDGSIITSSSLSHPHSADSLVIFKEGGDFKVMVTPMPQLAASYRIWYIPSMFTAASVDEVFPFLENYTNLIGADTALSLLPDCKYDAETRAEIKEAVGRDFQQYFAQFEEFKLRQFEAQTTRREAYGDDWEADSYFNF